MALGELAVASINVNWCLLELKAPVIAGKTLIKVGETQRRLGAAERDFIHSASINFLTPLRNFLEGDWRTISVSMAAGRGSSSHHRRRGAWGERETLLEELINLPHKQGGLHTSPLKNARTGECQSSICSGRSLWQGRVID